MAVQVDERAVLGKGVELGENVVIAPFAVIEDNVTIGDGTVVSSHAYIGSHTKIGASCKIFNGASVGTIAQDLKFRDEDAMLHIGDRTQIREFCTINKGTAENNGLTKIGNDCALLAYCHVAHDCEIGDNFVASNGLGMAGHVKVGNNVICGGNASIHQFCRIGDHAFVGATQYITMDILPFAMVSGDATGSKVVGINKVGLERRGFSSEECSMLKKAFKIIFREKLSLADAQERLKEVYGFNKHIETILSFISTSERGLLRM